MDDLGASSYTDNAKRGNNGPKMQFALIGMCFVDEKSINLTYKLKEKVSK